MDALALGRVGEGVKEEVRTHGLVWDTEELSTGNLWWWRWLSRGGTGSRCPPVARGAPVGARAVYGPLEGR